MHARCWVAISLLALVPVAALRVPVSASRRAVLGGVAGVACSSLTSLPASASLASELRSGESALNSASGSEEISAVLGQLLDLVEENEGLPTDALTRELVGTMRAKRSGLQGGKDWDGITEEAYNRLMRKVDPWRVTELEPVFQRSIIAYIPAYIALLVVQQLVPKVFNVAYAAAVAIVLGPLLAQIIIG
jgi:hypothetical protein